MGEAYMMRHLGKVTGEAEGTGIVTGEFYVGELYGAKTVTIRDLIGKNRFVIYPKHPFNFGDFDTNANSTELSGFRMIAICIYDGENVRISYIQDGNIDVQTSFQDATFPNSDINTGGGMFFDKTRGEIRNVSNADTLTYSYCYAFVGRVKYNYIAFD